MAKTPTSAPSPKESVSIGNIRCRPTTEPATNPSHTSPQPIQVSLDIQTSRKKKPHTTIPPSNPYHKREPKNGSDTSKKCAPRKRYVRKALMMSILIGISICRRSYAPMTTRQLKVKRSHPVVSHDTLSRTEKKYCPVSINRRPVTSSKSGYCHDIRLSQSRQAPRSKMKLKRELGRGSGRE